MADEEKSSSAKGSVWSSLSAAQRERRSEADRRSKLSWGERQQEAMQRAGLRLAAFENMNALLAYAGIVVVIMFAVMFFKGMTAGLVAGVLVAYFFFIGYPSYSAEHKLTAGNYLGLCVMAVLAGSILKQVTGSIAVVLALSAVYFLLLYLDREIPHPVEYVVVSGVIVVSLWFLTSSIPIAIGVGIIAGIGIAAPFFSMSVLVYVAVLLCAQLVLLIVPEQMHFFVVPVVLVFLALVPFVLLSTHHAGSAVGGLVVLAVYLLLVFSGWGIPGVEQGSPLDHSAIIMKEAIVQIPQDIKEMFSEAQGSYQRQIALAKGDFAAYQIDKDAVKQAGVFLSPLKSSEQRVLAGSPASFFSTLRAQALDEQVTITVTCENSKNPLTLLGPCESKGKENECVMVIEGEESVNLDCVMDAPVAGPGTLTLQAGFEFTTRSYLPVYLMEQEKLRDLRRRNLDPLEGFEEKSPVATTTAGPVRVGIAVPQQPVGVGMTGGSGPTVGVTIDNAWDGELKAITEVVLFLPKGLKAESVAGARVSGMKQIGCGQLVGQLRAEAKLCDDKLHNVYVLESEGEEPFGTYTSFRVYTQVEEGAELLGAAPISVRNIRVSAMYEYVLEQRQVFTAIAPSSEKKIQVV